MLCAQKPFDGVMISIQKVPPPMAIQVYGAKAIPDDMLKIFIESKTSQNSVRYVEDTEFKFCKLVHFNEKEGMHLICHLSS